MHEADQPNAVVNFLEPSNGDIQVGSTDDLRRRVAFHQQGHVISTSQ
jgi:predicted GIY-YIG superfamily endonuclease